MTTTEIIRMRLGRQQLLHSPYQNAEDVVRWMGAVQSQDYAGAKWALACRMTDPVEAEIDKSVDDGRILRTHVLRPTWHFVNPDDIRWMIELTEPRITSLSAKYLRDLRLDDALLKKTNGIIVRALEKGGHLTKKELGEILTKARIDTTELRLTFIIFRAELDCLICNGRRKGKQSTYALFEERAPDAKRLEKNESLYELALRYFTSRGPASLKDFAWWSGLNGVDAKRALELVEGEVNAERNGNETYYFTSQAGGLLKRVKSSHLLPAWDEYTVAYKDRTSVIDPVFETEAGHGIFNPNIVDDGKLIGTWRREIKREKVLISLRYFQEPSPAVAKRVAREAEKFAKFVGKEADITVL